MDRHIIIFPVATCLALLIGPVLGDDLDVGETLYDENCSICHDSNIFTRAEHKMKSIEQLRRQVVRCQWDMGADWSAAQIHQVIEYLNHTYYKFQ